MDAAFQYLERWQEEDQPDVRFEVAVSRADTQAGGRGIYLREPADTCGAVRFTARVSPTFHEVWTFSAPSHWRRAERQGHMLNFRLYVVQSEYA